VRRLLGHREFRLLFLGQTASSIGDEIVFIALALYVSDIGDPTDVGIVLAAGGVPFVVFLLLGGIWADRLPRHRLMIATDLVRAALHATLAVLIFIGPVPIWQIVLIELGFGTAEAFFRPAYTGLLPQTVPEDELQAANAAGGFVFNSAEFVGPALATALVLGAGAGWAFSVDAATFLVSAALLSRMRPRARGEETPRGRILAELRVGWREVRSRQWVWVTIAITSLTLLVAVTPYFTLGPTIAEEVYGSKGIYGYLAAVLGGGTVIGSLIALRWRPAHPMRAGFAWLLVSPASVSAFALGLPLVLLVPLFVVAGTGFGLFAVWWDTALAERIPAHTLSRVSSYDWMGSFGLLPLGFLLSGPLGEAFGAVEVLAVAGAVGFAVQALGLLSPSVWRLEG
jgi:predicted MFS family arabinose efflux permease